MAMTPIKRTVLTIGACAVALLVAGIIGMTVLNVLVKRGYEPKWTVLRAVEIRRAANTWRGAHSSDLCPTPEFLQSSGAIDASAVIVDPWESPYRIACEPDETIVFSLGPDKRPGTPDDIRVPEVEVPQK